MCNISKFSLHLCFIEYLEIIEIAFSILQNLKTTFSTLNFFTIDILQCIPLFSIFCYIIFVTHFFEEVCNCLNTLSSYASENTVNENDLDSNSLKLAVRALNQSLKAPLI